jgi:hypothetical protein
VADGAVMVYFGETEIFERQVPQGVQRGGNGGFAALYPFKKLLNLL